METFFEALSFLIASRVAPSGLLVTSFWGLNIGSVDKIGVALWWTDSGGLLVSRLWRPDSGMNTSHKINIGREGINTAPIMILRRTGAPPVVGPQKTHCWSHVRAAQGFHLLEQKASICLNPRSSRLLIASERCIARAS